MLNADAWQRAEDLVRELIADVVRPTGAEVEVGYVQGVPPVVNDPGAVEVLARGRPHGRGPRGRRPRRAEPGRGGLRLVPPARPRGPGPPGRPPAGCPGPPHDLHQPDFDIDEDTLAIGVRLLARTAVAALGGRPA